jgi:ribosomal protein S27E
LENETDETRRVAYKNGYNEGYKKGYEKGFEEGMEKGKRKAHHPQIQFLRVSCECGTTNFHPVFENKLIINDDEERRCYGCGKIIARDDILGYYSRLQSNRS